MEPFRPGESPPQRASNSGRSAFDLLVRNPDLADLLKVLRRAAPSDAPVLIVGESGTGKELVAHAIHEQSPRHAAPLACLNFAAVPIELSETILFGHELGAFTGALRAARGFCRAADMGTLFLDEISESSLALQAKLLRFLQSGEVQPVGSEQVITVDVRIITATNRDLAVAIREKQFREDLFHRLNVVQVRIPPLRERPHDIPLLIDFFLEELNAKYGRRCSITNAAREVFQAFDWPGNVRQLRAVIESVIILTESNTIGLSDLPQEIHAGSGMQRAAATDESSFEAGTEFDLIMSRVIRDILEHEDGNVARAARRLGMSRATLYRRLKKGRPARGGAGQPLGMENRRTGRAVSR